MYMMKCFVKLFLFFVLSATVLQAQDLGSDYSAQMQKLITSYRMIGSLYVDDVDYENIVESSIVSMLKELDPHSAYISPDDVKKMNEPLKGNFDGIGIQFNVLDDTLIVVSPIPGGPSEKVGIRAGDRIVKVDTTTIAGVKCSRTKMMNLLRGEKGTEVRVLIKRPKKKDLVSFTIIRDKIPIYSLDASYMVNDHLGYIKLNRFSATTHDEFMKALKALEKEGMEDLILDLQSNGGGYMQPAIKIAEEFLARKELIVYTEGRRSPKKTFAAQGAGAFKQGDLVVLVDEASASASEILTGAIQDWDRGLLVGRRTFGKGLVQRPLNLPDGAMMRLTVARYHTPSGRCIQKPYVEGDKEDYYKELNRRYEHGEMVNADSINFPDSLKYQTLKKQRIVYGGGGIFPDVFVPMDTTSYSDFHRKVITSGVFNQYMLSYTDSHREELKKAYPDFETFNSNFAVDNELFDGLVQAAAKDSIVFDDEEFEVSRNYLNIQIKSIVARDLFEASDYYRIINQLNEIYLKAIEVMDNKRKYFDVL